MFVCLLLVMCRTILCRVMIYFSLLLVSCREETGKDPTTVFLLPLLMVFFFFSFRTFGTGDSFLNLASVMSLLRHVTQVGFELPL